MKRIILYSLLPVLMIVFISFHRQSITQATVTHSTNIGKGLKDYYANFFPIGVAISPRSLKGADSQLIVQQFNSLTPENAMKMGPIHPQQNRYFWTVADSIVNLAQAHGMKVRG